MNATLKLQYAHYGFGIFFVRNGIFYDNLFTMKKIFETTNWGIFGNINAAIIPYEVDLHSLFCADACISSGRAAITEDIG